MRKKIEDGFTDFFFKKGNFNTGIRICIIGIWMDPAFQLYAEPTDRCPDLQTWKKLRFTVQIEMEKLVRRSLAESFSGIIRRKASFDVTGEGPLLPPR